MSFTTKTSRALLRRGTADVGRRSPRGRHLRAARGDLRERSAARPSARRRAVRPISTCCSSRSTRRAPIAFTPTASTAVETPNLDRLAREGVLFEQAVSPAPLTLPAHSSIFTGTFPPAHGVRDNGGFFLDERETTLAERLQSRGFTTGGFVGAYVLDHKWGIAQGFQTYFDDFDLSKYQSLSLGSVDRPGNEVADKALAWLDGVGVEALLRLGALLRRALAVRSARAVQVALRRASLRRRDRVRRLAGRPAARLSRRAPPRRPHGRRRHGRSRREPRRARRGDARLLRLPGDDARAAADSGAVRRDGGAARGRHGPQHRHPADGARAARRASRRSRSRARASCR